MSTIRLQFTWKEDGVLTNLTSAVLSNSGATFGVRRTDTLATVVVAGTAFTNPSTGVYVYDFTAPAAGLTYNYWIKYVRAGVTSYVERTYIDAASNSMDITRVQLHRIIGRYLGYGRDSTDWTSDQAQDVNDIIDSGLRQFYTPMPLPGERTAHTWSFMRPMLDTTMVVDDTDYDLPSDFGGFAGSLYFPASDEAYGCPIRQTGVGEILSLRQNSASDTSSRPTLYAVYPKASTGAAATVWNLAVWPAPDATYTLRGQYIVNPLQLASGAPYPLGGQPHAETLRESCLAAAELELNDERGIHYAQFIERLAASVSLDRNVSTPDYFGYNGDRSSSSRVLERHQNPEVTYNGTLYLSN